MEPLVVLTDWLQKHTDVPGNGVLLLDFSKICRLCLKDSVHLYGIKDHLVGFEDGSAFLKQAIEILTDIKNDENDQHFPQNICSTCSEMVSKCYEFTIRCKKTREALLLYNKIISQDIVRDLDDGATIIKNECTSQVQLNQNEEMELYDNSYDHQEDCDNTEPVFKIEVYDQLNDKINGDKLSLACTHCSESFSKRTELSKHLKTTHKDKTLVCNICNQSFTQIQTLKRHSKIHQSDQRNKLCPFCGKRFVRTDDLRRHIRIHTNERPYACDRCDKKYKQTSELKEHKKSHSNLKSYQCNICGKTLATRNGIYVHMKVHNGIKNHICQTCDTKYVTAGQLASHIKHIHSKQKSFTCSYENCVKGFVTNIALRAHLQSHYSEKQQFHRTSCGKLLASSKLSDHKLYHAQKIDRKE